MFSLTICVCAHKNVAMSTPVFVALKEEEV